MLLDRINRSKLQPLSSFGAKAFCHTLKRIQGSLTEGEVQLTSLYLLVWINSFYIENFILLFTKQATLIEQHIFYTNAGKQLSQAATDVLYLC
jgi:hypothetical protein